MPRFPQNPSPPFLFSWHLHLLHSLAAPRMVVLLRSRVCAPRGLPDGSAGRSFKTDPSAADPVLPRHPQGGLRRKRRHFQSRMGDRGQKEKRMSGGERLMKDCITGKPVIYCITSSNCLKLNFFFPSFPSSLSKLPALRCRLKRQHIHFAITQESCRKNNGGKKVT